MRKRDALRLKPGDKVLCANTTKAENNTQYWVGRVVHVTPAGGVLVEILEGRDGGWDGPGTGPYAGTEMWFQYNHVVRKL